MLKCLKLIILIFFFQMPIDFDFKKTFDMFLKVHKVFHLNFCPAFVKLMQFIDYFVFENKCDDQTTATMRKLAEKLNLSNLKARNNSSDI